MSKSNISSVHLQRLYGRLGDVVWEITKMRFSHFRPHPIWGPPLNIYRCEQCFVVCADLAGVNEKSVELKVQPRRLLIRGRREAPEPRGKGYKALRVLAMEIDCGPFQREVLFPAEIETARVTMKQSNGMVSIHLPLKSEA